MGSVPQLNTPDRSWISFFINQRLSPLVEMCITANLLPGSFAESIANLYEFLPKLFGEAVPSLLHGDLWSGNFLCNKQAQPVLIDPAVYFGHRSIDLGMTTLFGGFDKEFYEAYHYHYPFPDNYKEQWEVCNLYPLLIHLLLFGKSYLRQIQATVHKYSGQF
jgi:fructosamine-3-kinase